MYKFLSVAVIATITQALSSDALMQNQLSIMDNHDEVEPADSVPRRRGGNGQRKQRGGGGRKPRGPPPATNEDGEVPLGLYHKQRMYEINQDRRAEGLKPIRAKKGSEEFETSREEWLAKYKPERAEKLAKRQARQERQAKKALW